jgi:hypothetical protein
VGDVDWKRTLITIERALVEGLEGRTSGVATKTGKARVVALILPLEAHPAQLAQRAGRGAAGPAVGPAPRPDGRRVVMARPLRSLAG